MCRGLNVKTKVVKHVQAILHVSGGETWVVSVDNMMTVERIGMRILPMICGSTLKAESLMQT